MCGKGELGVFWYGFFNIFFLLRVFFTPSSFHNLFGEESVREELEEEPGLPVEEDSVLLPELPDVELSEDDEPDGDDDDDDDDTVDEAVVTVSLAFFFFAAPARPAAAAGAAGAAGFFCGVEDAAAAAGAAFAFAAAGAAAADDFPRDDGAAGGGAAAGAADAGFFSLVRFTAAAGKGTEGAADGAAAAAAGAAPAASPLRALPPPAAGAFGAAAGGAERRGLPAAAAAAAADALAGDAAAAAADGAARRRRVAEGVVLALGSPRVGEEEERWWRDGASSRSAVLCAATARFTHLCGRRGWAARSRRIQVKTKALFQPMRVALISRAVTSVTVALCHSMSSSLTSTRSSSTNCVCVWRSCVCFSCDSHTLALARPAKSRLLMASTLGGSPSGGGKPVHGTPMDLAISAMSRSRSIEGFSMRTRRRTPSVGSFRRPWS